MTHTLLKNVSALARQMRGLVRQAHLFYWEELSNPDFKPLEFERFRKQKGLNSSNLTAKQRKGFELSTSNLKYMRCFAQECPERKIGQQSSDQLPWFHIVTLIGVAEYQLVRALPKPLDTCLPTIKELETELSRELEEDSRQ